MHHRARALSALLAGGLVLAALPAAAQEGMLFQNLMRNLGVLPGGGDEIEYRERPPLVVPPNAQLPRPQEAAAGSNPAWPNDPDVAARREQQNSLLRPAATRRDRQNNPLLSQEELRQGRIAGGRAAAPASEGTKGYEENIAPIRIGRDVAARRNADAEANLRYGVEPRRRLLTDPPTGYRMPASTARLGPGQQGPREDTVDATGQREFAAGLPPPTTR